MRLAASLLVSSVLLSSAALAENARLAAAIRLYQRAELDAAMAELKAAEEQSKDEGDLVQVLVYRGLVYAETGQNQQMQESFKRALAMRPWTEVPHDTSPRLAKMFNDARREVWGSPGIKPWPKQKAGAAPADKPAEKPAVQPAAPPPAPATESKPAESPAAPPTADPAGEKPATATPPGDAPTTPPPPADDQPDIAPTTP